MNRIAIRVLKILSPVLFFVTTSAAQKGYIYVHVNALNEESSPDFQFSINSGPTVIPDFYLNDQPFADNALNDIGASHGVTTNGLGNGELWVSLQSSFQIYHRPAGSSQWSFSGMTGTSLDGAGPGQFVNTDNNGNAYFYDGATQQMIYAAAAHGGIKATDVTWANGRIGIVTEDGAILRNDGISAPYTDSWTLLVATGASRLDMQLSTGQIVYYDAGSNAVFTLPFTGGIATNIGTPGGKDIAFDDDGNIYANASRWAGGTNWIADRTRYTTFNNITGAASGLVWSTCSTPDAVSAIYARTPDQGIWVDEERVRASYKSNAIILPVDAGTYTLNVAAAMGWAFADFTLYDPTSNSSVTPGSARAALNVAAGEIVHVTVYQALLKPLAVSQACGVASTEDFSTVAPSTATSYHYTGSNTLSDGYYTIAATDNTGTLNDHTTGTGNMMLVNAAFQKDYFYRQRLTNLLAGEPYKLTFWVANTNITAPVKPEILAGVATTDGVVISSLGTGAITSNSWTLYTFSFTASSNIAEVFLRNNASGIDGNDLAIDDIAIVPMSGVLPASMIIPNTPGLCKGSTAVISNSTPGGAWSTNNPLAVTVDATGKLTAVGAGYADVTYTVTDAAGCKSTAITSIPVYALPDVIAVADKANICSGASVNLSATVTATIAPYSIKWTSLPSGGSIDNDQLLNTTASPSIAGRSHIYIATATDARGCTSSGTTNSVTVNALPVASIDYATDICKAGVMTVRHTGTTAGIYTGTPGLVIDAVTGTIDLEMSTSGAHTVTYTFSDGQCTNMATTSFTIRDLPILPAITGPSGVCAGDKISLSNAFASGTWSTNDNTIATIAPNGTFTGVSAGTSTVFYTVTDSYGCTSEVSTNITVDALPWAVIAYPRSVYCITAAAADVTQTGITGGTFNATPGLSINRTTGRIDPARSLPGSYTVAYAFSNGACSNITTTTVIIEAIPVIAPVTGDANVCIGNVNASVSSITPGGQWRSNNTDILTVDAAGRVTGVKPGTAVITYEVTSVNGCSDQADFTIQVPPQPDFIATTKTATCSNSADGGITIAAPGPGYQYALNAGTWQPGNTFSNLQGGAYKVQMMDRKGCVSEVKDITVPAPLAIGLIITTKDITCHGENSGSLALTAVGGTAPYRIAWSNGANSPKISNLPAGEYVVTVTDQHGCSSSQKVELAELFPVFIVNDPVKQEGGLLKITGTAIPNADILVTYPDGSLTTTHTDRKGNFSTLSPKVVGTGRIVVSVTDPASKGACTKNIDYNNTPVADLFVINTVSLDIAPTVGDEAKFVITVNNKGLDHASQVIVTDNISGMLEDIGNMSATGGSARYNVNTRQVVWNIDTLYVNKPMQLSFTARVAFGGMLENSAIISARETDPNADNNEFSMNAIEISPDLFIPNVITANGDGKNDYFVVRGIDQYPGSSLDVFNRWGAQVYRSSNYTNNWGGAGLTAGIYYYVLKINMSRAVKVYKGYIELIQN